LSSTGFFSSEAAPPNQSGHTQSDGPTEAKLDQGDFVFIAAKGTHEREPCVYIDLYRVEDAKIAEHWGFSEKIPLQEERNNNGML
jgi:predicted SnoaL-like aldol condensation-catalyzing enzyme